MARIRTWKTGKTVKIKDVLRDGKVIWRKRNVYKDDDGNEYVILGSFSLYSPNALIPLEHMGENHTIRRMWVCPNEECSGLYGFEHPSILDGNDDIGYTCPSCGCHTSFPEEDCCWELYSG